MSSDPHAHGHDAHESHTFDAEPVKELAADEPRTPGWLPVLGIALFTAAAVWILTTGGDPPAENAKPEEPTAAAAPPTPQEPQPPAGHPAPQVKKLSPEQAKAMQEQVERAHAKGVLPVIKP